MFTPIQKLDIILKMFAPQKDGSIVSFTYKDIQLKVLGQTLDINTEEVPRILD